MNIINKLRKEVVLSSIIYIIVGGIFFIYPTMSANIIAYILAGTLLAFGIAKLITYRRFESIGFKERLLLLVGAVAVGLGIFIIVNPTIVFSILPFIAGVFMIVEALSMIQNINGLKENKDAHSISLILMIILLLGGIIIVINPFSIAKSILMLIGAFFIFDGVSQLWTVNQIKQIEMK